MVTKRFLIGGTWAWWVFADLLYGPAASKLGATIITLPGLGIGHIEGMFQGVMRQIRAKLLPGEHAELHCHSLGAIVGVKCADQLLSEGQSAHVVSYGGPHGGLKTTEHLSRLWGMSDVAPAWCEIAVGSPFMMAYKPVLSRVQDHLVTVFDRRDQIVDWESSIVMGSPLNVMVGSDADGVRLTQLGYNVVVLRPSVAPISLMSVLGAHSTIISDRNVLRVVDRQLHPNGILAA